jgi:NADPH:quinone reductase-like Zn-dependent oxidoreductase
MWAHAALRSPPDGDEVVGDVRIVDGDGLPLLETRGLTLRRVAAAPADLDRWLYEPVWACRARPPALVAGDQPHAWLVLADRGAVAARLVSLLEGRGAACAVVRAAGGDAAPADAVDPRDPAAMRAAVEQAARAGRPLRGAIHLWSLDAPAVEEADPASLARAQDLGVTSTVHLARALGELGLEAPRLVLVTAGAQAVSAAEPPEAAQAPVWALARVLRYEVPELDVRSVDLGRAALDDEVHALVGEILRARGPDDEVSLRGRDRHVLRLRRASTARTGTAPPALRRGRAASFRLESPATGLLDDLVLRESHRRAPGPGEVEIEVAAAGLNFFDVVHALGLIPGITSPGPAGRASQPLVFGFECAGRVTAVGPGVEGLAVGQAVAAVAEASRGCLSRHVVTPAALVAVCPPGLDLLQAATLPVAFLTACYAMEHIGRLTAGERVLIHCASGGVGLAAVQVARRAGAIVFATAGSEEKREYLRRLGVEHVFDSRTLAFAPAIRDATLGEGVDMVLNSLAGEALRESLALLRPDGRFLEIGKRDIYEDRQLGLLPFRRCLTFAHVDVARLLVDRPALIGRLLRRVFEDIAAGALSPLPVEPFAASSAVDAFRHMAQARHIGKVALTFDAPEVAAAVQPRTEAAVARPDATYLVTGGLGGLGLVVARWLAEQGARHLVLCGRSAPGPAAEEAIERLRAAGVEVVAAACDVSRAGDVARVLARIQATMPPLAGVIHAAVVLDDGLAAQLTADRIAAVMAPKMLGAWNLHEQTLGLPLDFFALFSSAASTLGSPGQGNYAAANEFMDALARHRRARGLCALSINWGPWSESGAAVRPDRAGRLVARGIGGMRDREGLELLGRLLRSGRGEAVVIPSADWREWVRFYPAAARMGMFEELLAEAPAPAPAPREQGGRAAIAAAPPEERPRLLEEYLFRELRRVLGIPAGRALDAGLPLNRFGIDSLMAVELRNRIDADLGVSIPISRILLGAGVTQVARELLDLLAADRPAPAAAGGGIDQLLQQMDQLGDEGALALLDDLLDDDEEAREPPAA